MFGARYSKRSSRSPFKRAESRVERRVLYKSIRGLPRIIGTHRAALRTAFQGTLKRIRKRFAESLATRRRHLEALMVG